MPYIHYPLREYYKPEVVSATERNPGILNYQITMLVQEYLDANDESYAVYNDIIGALEACKLEFYRRAIVPYEDEKIEQNGDVYE